MAKNPHVHTEPVVQAIVHAVTWGNSCGGRKLLA